MNEKQGFSPGNLLKLTSKGHEAYALPNGLTWTEPVMLINPVYEDDVDYEIDYESGISWTTLVNRRGEAKIETWIIVGQFWEVVA